MASIIIMMDNNHLKEIGISDSYDPTSVIWWDNDDSPREGLVKRVKLAECELSLIVECEDGDITVYDDDFPLTNLGWLASIRDNILEEIKRQHPRVCEECGKPITDGYCIGGGMEYYCCTSCLFKNYTPQEWVEMYDHGNSDCYYSEWEGDRDE